MHPTGFEPVTFLRKWIMSPVPSTTRSRVQNLEPMGFEPMCIYKYVNSEGSLNLK